MLDALFFGMTPHFKFAIAHAFLRLARLCMNAGSNEIPLILKLSMAR